MLQKLATVLTGAPEAEAAAPPAAHPAEVVQRGLEHFHGVIAERDRLRIELQALQLDNARLSTELDVRLADLREALREREHYMSYAYTLTTQLNSVDELIRQALSLAKSHPVTPPRPATIAVETAPLPPLELPSQPPAHANGSAS